MRNMYIFLIMALICTIPFELSASQRPPQNKSEAQGIEAVSVSKFLNSLGAVSSISRRGETLEGSIVCMKYTGLRWLRAGFEDRAPVSDFIQLYEQTGTKISYGMLSGHSDISRLIDGAKQIGKSVV